MPRRFKARKGRKGRKGRKSSKGYKTLVNTQSLMPIAQRYITKMKYAEVVGASSGGSSYGAYRFNLNSIFDPNQTGIGHQPYGHDTFQSLYNRYRVISCRYRISAISSDSANLQIAVIPTNETISPINISEVRENPRAKYALQANGSPLKIISGTVSIPSLVGRTKAQYMADDRYQAQFGASPSEAALLTMYAGPTSESGTTATIYFNVQLEYLVEMFDVKHLNQS